MPTTQVIHLERPLRCYCNCSGLTCYCCCSCCAPHEIEVQSPPGTVIGYVRQDPLGILNPWFSIENAEGDCVMKIKGPTLGCSCYSDANFDVSTLSYHYCSSTACLCCTSFLLRKRTKLFQDMSQSMQGICFKVEPH